MTAARTAPRTAVVVPLPETEAAVHRHRLLFDPVARRCMPAHVTLMFPFVSDLEAALDGVGEICGATAPFDVVFTRTHTFEPKGVLTLAPDPAAPFIALTEQIASRFDLRPFGGEFDPEIVPHVTIAQTATPDERLRIERELALPLHARAREIWVMREEPDRWYAHARFRLGEGEAVPIARKTIVVADHDERWAGLFEDEKARLAGALGDLITTIEHVGSTSVAGLAAKPIIDIMLGIATLDDGPLLVAPLEAIGYEYVPEFETALPLRRFFRRDVDGVRTHNLHVAVAGTPFWGRHIRFRDRLRSDDAACDSYATLKRDLAGRFGDDIDGYTDAKTAFIKEMERERG